MRVKRVLQNQGDKIENELWQKEVPLLSEPLVQEVHQKRCEADPIYQLLLFPAEEIPVYDPHTERLLYHTTFIDRLIDGVHQMLLRRYGEAMQKERLVVDMFEVLKKPSCDTQIKVFTMMFLIKWEPMVCELIRDLYDTEAEESLFEQDAITQYNSLLRLLDRWVEQTINYPFSQYSIGQLVDNFLHACTKEYVMGPFQ